MSAPQAAPSRLGVLAERDFRQLFLARTISLLGTSIAPIALAFAVLDDLGGSATELGIVLAAASVPQILFLLVGGVWADRLPRHLVMVASDLTMFGTQAATALLLFTDTAALWHLALLQGARGLASAFFFPAATGVVPQVVSAARLQQANALLGLTVSSAGVAGALLGGVLVATVGPATALAFDAATFLASAACLVRIRLPKDLTLPARHFVRELKEGWQEFTSRTWLWVIVAVAALDNMVAQGAFFVLGPVVADESLGGASAWGLIMAGFGAGFVGGGLLMLRFRPERPLFAACVALLLYAFPFPLLAVAAPAPLIAAAALVAGFGLEIFGTLWNTALQEHVPRERLSRVSAYDYLGSFVFIPIGLAIAGPVADQIGIAEALWAAGAIVLVSTVAQLFVSDIRNLRRLGAEAPEAVSAEA